MRILIIIDVIDSGGVSSILRNILNNIDLKKYSFDILVFEKNEKYESLLPKNINIRHVYQNNPAKQNNKFLRYSYSFLKEKIPKWLINKLIIKYEYDIAIDFKGNNLNVLNAAKCKKVFWSHKDFSPITNPIEKEIIRVYSKTRQGRLKENLFKKNIHNVDKVVCISEACKLGFLYRWKYDESKIKVLYNVLDVYNIKNKANSYIPYKKSSKFTFCCMTRISNGKGIERLLKSAKLLNESGYIFDLNIIGDGDSFNNMVKLSESMGLKNVYFFGNKLNPYPYVRECDVFIYPSETEAYSTALCEAIIIGKAVISCNTASIKEILGNNKYGYVIENNQTAIFNSMKDFIDNPNLQTIYETRSKKRVSYFDINNRINEIERFFNEIK